MSRLDEIEERANDGDMPAAQWMKEASKDLRYLIGVARAAEYVAASPETSEEAADELRAALDAQ